MNDERLEYHRSFANLTFADFRLRADDKRLTPNEKVGFPREYRDGLTGLIFGDILSKLPAIKDPGSTVLDIGCGCGDLAHHLIQNAAQLNQHLALIDSEEMLDAITAHDSVRKFAGEFPSDCDAFIQTNKGQMQSILVYSVIQYVFIEGSLFSFLDACLALLAPGGRCLLGDIPNRSMRDRFFYSETGARSHREFTNSTSNPQIEPFQLTPNLLDDSIVMALVNRARSAGFHAFIMPQDPNLPMANRREDILIVRP
ncbi:MAG: class I SAM-dependent methyltransferase [Planctomycetaceae bacterium]|nr:class I SAM-dependent methyltransferase [Planctomycetales bacterium]MCB9922491.1 class I SAM-dependent methyltransferase [Planctomycetaceae bacterium]